MGNRTAFVANAFAPELGAHLDTPTVFDRLTDPDLGGCIKKNSRLLHDCKTKDEFEKELDTVLAQWDSQDQLLFYFGGHGEYRNKQYAFKIGSSFLPFAGMFSSIQFAGVSRAVLILDTCHAGAAMSPIGKRGLPDEFQIDAESLPLGIAIVAACRPYEKASDLKDGSAGVFTTLLLAAMDNGLNVSTADDKISIEDLIDYVRKRMANDENFKNFPQHPIYEVHGAEARIWISANKTKQLHNKEHPAVGGGLRSREELQVAYEHTLPSLRPCIGATRDLLSWELVDKFAEESGFETESTLRSNERLKELGLYSELSTVEPQEVHKAAVLCFFKDPQRFVRQARAIFLFGEPGRQTTTAIRGPLSEQFHKLFELVMEELDNVTVTGDDGFRTTEKKILRDVVREVISNAIAHRDYEATSHIIVDLRPNELIVTNPGSFPPGATWEKLLKESGLSIPRDEAVAMYVTFLLAFEGIGQGFRVFRDYREKFGGDAIIGHETLGNLVQVRVKRRRSNAKELAGLPPGFDLESYREAFVERFGNLDFEMLDTTGAYYSGVRLWSVFVPQSVRRAHEYTPQLLEMPKENLQRLAEAGELDTDDLGGEEHVNLLRRQYVSQPLQSVLEVVGHVENLSCTKTVILGDPGSGKSSLMRFLALRWARIEDANLRYTQPLPLLIELRDYNAWECAGGRSFPRYLHEASTWHRLNQQTLDHLLNQADRVVLLLDGLDEVFDPVEREQVVNDIHRFSNEYPDVRDRGHFARRRLPPATPARC